MTTRAASAKSPFWSLRRVLIACALVITAAIAAGILVNGARYRNLAMDQLRRGIELSLRFSITDRLERAYPDWFGAGINEVSRMPALVRAYESGDGLALAAFIDDLVLRLGDAGTGINEFPLFTQALRPRGVILHTSDFAERLAANPAAAGSALDHPVIRAALLARTLGEQRQLTSIPWRAASGEAVHSFLVPVGGFRRLGFLEIVSDPRAVMAGIGEALGGRLELMGPGGQVLFAQGELVLADPARPAIAEIIRYEQPGFAGTPWAEVVFATDVTSLVEQIDLAVRRAILAAGVGALVLWISAHIVLRRVVFAKLHSFAAAMTAVSRGARNVAVPAVPRDEFGEMAAALVNLGAAVEERDRSTETQRALVETLRAQAAELQVARDAAEAASRAKSQFLTSVSHELRTPLHAISGFAQLLEAGDGGALSPTQRDYLGHVLDAAEHLGRLIDDILDLARIEAGGVSLDAESVHLGELFDACQAALTPAARQGGITLIFEPPPAPRAILRGDRTRLLQCLINLGSNAVKYNRPGGIVRFALEDLGPGWVRVVVEDDGIGIPPDRGAELFQPFNRLGREHGSVQGTGIGLAITRALVERMGGRIGYLPRAGGGSLFHLDLPRGANPDPVTRRLAPTPPDPVPAGGFRVLYVEDDPAHALLVEKIIARLPETDFTNAPTLYEGLVAARARPDLILLDMNLPDGDGYRFLEQMRALPGLDAVPVIAVSASATPDDRARAARAGVVAFVAKPLKVADLFEAIQRAMAAAPTGES